MTYSNACCFYITSIDVWNDANRWWDHAMKWYVRGWNMLQSLQHIKTHHNAVTIWDGWCHAFGVAGWNGWYIKVDNDYCWTQSFDFSGNEWKHDISFAPTQSTWEARPTQWLEQYSWQSVSFVKWSRFTINKLLWTFERRRYVFGHHSHGPHATMKLRFHEELKGNVRAQKHLLDTTAPN